MKSQFSRRVSGSSPMRSLVSFHRSRPLLCFWTDSWGLVYLRHAQRHFIPRRETTRNEMYDGAICSMLSLYY